MSRISKDQIIEFSLEEVRSEKTRLACSLLGRLFTVNNVSLRELRDTVNNSWQGQGRIRVSQAAHGFLEFVLPNKTSKAWILKQTPWVIGDKILHLRSWTPSITRRTFEELAIALFRIQMWGVRDECYTHQFGRKMASAALGRVIEAGLFACSDTDQKFIKVKAMIDFSKPLRSQLMASNDETGAFWIRLKYEHLPSFCYHCGRVGHSRQACGFDPPSGTKRYGPHMTTKKMGRRIFDDEEEAPHYPPRSVWINKEIRGQKEPEYAANRDRMEEDRGFVSSTKQPVQDPSPLWLGTSYMPFLETEPRVHQNRNSFWVAVSKGPRVVLGGQGRKGPIRKKADAPTPMPPLPCESMVEAKDRPRDRAHQRRSRHRVHGERREKQQLLHGEVRQEQPILPSEREVSRRRRLVLLEESEDEFFVHEVPVAEGGTDRGQVENQPMLRADQGDDQTSTRAGQQRRKLKNLVLDPSTVAQRKCSRSGN
ncbi:unnamed protein product [Linum trigynum]|uniref:CCHC-type domain-containing protein n=1 Tax=Linum trigynum TaxID=586398 RepID=A0AAV2FME2_9ROSI